MKKYIFCVILLLISTFLIIGCVPTDMETEPEDMETEPVGIELTLENYKEYLHIEKHCGKINTTYFPELGAGITHADTYFTTYSVVPGGFKNVEITFDVLPSSLKYAFTELFDDDDRSKTCVEVNEKQHIYTEVKLPADGKFTSTTYELLDLTGIVKDVSSFWSYLEPEIFVRVKSISGTFIPN